MKKTLIVIVASFTLICLVATASAASFSGVTLDCTSAMTYRSLGGSWTATSAHHGAVYVYYTIGTSGVASYTNHFRAYVSSSSSAVGNKWIAPKNNIPIQSSSIVSGSVVTIKARGNTKFADDGFDTISISGTYGWPQ